MAVPTPNFLLETILDDENNFATIDAFLASNKDFRCQNAIYYAVQKHGTLNSKNQIIDNCNNIQTLIKVKRCNIDYKDEFGRTALFYAASKRDLKLVANLLFQGKASPFIKDVCGNTADQYDTANEIKILISQHKKDVKTNIVGTIALSLVLPFMALEGLCIAGFVCARSKILSGFSLAGAIIGTLGSITSLLIPIFLMAPDDSDQGKFYEKTKKETFENVGNRTLHTEGIKNVSNATPAHIVDYLA